MKNNMKNKRRGKKWLFGNTWFTPRAL